MIDLETVARYSPVLRLPLFSVGWFMPLALLGLWAARKRPDVRLLGAWTLSMWVGLAAFFILARYRMALLPAVVPLATVGAAQLLAWVQERDWKRTGIAAVAVAALTATLFIEPYLARVLRGLSPLNVAVIFSNVGQYAEAEALMRYGAQQAPEQPAAWCALGNHYAAFKRWNEARDAVTRCLAADQRYRGAYLLLGRVEEVAGNVEAARTAYQRQLKLIPGEQEAAMRLEALSTTATPAPPR
jgi:tetratricopeptide (TPR) repeat protein